MKINKSKIRCLIFALMLTLANPVHAEKIADAPYLHMGAVVATMAACAFIAPDDINADTHCFGGVAETFLLEMGFADTKYQAWAPAAITCVTGALWEIRDHQGHGVASFDDFAWTCLPAITTNYGLNGIISFYKEKNAYRANIRVEF